MIAISFLLINRDGYQAIVYAKELATQNTRKALISIKEETNLIKESVLLDAPILNQLPELPRGCEVTSLAMLLQYADVDVDKMTLAKQIKKDTTPYTRVDGKIYYGHPNDGFVGDMYSLSGPGLGVYHKPIAALAEKYLPDSIVDFTGSDFEEIKNHLSNNRPVWVITNSTFKKLPESQFRTWNTPSGTVKITYSEHSVLITGYDETSIYFNDPLTGEKNKKAPIKDFEESWVQMGSQAITINS
ncbi:C39 family peptidase [Niallia circulans]